MKQLTAGTILTLIMLVGNVNAEGTQAKASNHENAIEATLQVEKWMTDEITWDVNHIDGAATEQELKVEDWMVESKWELNNMVATEQEAPLKTENWMTTGQAWFTGEFDSAMETALVIENWMINDNVWK